MDGWIGTKCAWSDMSAISAVSFIVLAGTEGNGQVSKD